MFKRLFGKQDDDFDKVPEMKLPKNEKKFFYCPKRKRYCFEGDNDDEIDKKNNMPPPKMELQRTTETAKDAPRTKQDPKKINVAKRYASAMPVSNDLVEEKKGEQPSINLNEEKQQPRVNQREQVPEEVMNTNSNVISSFKPNTETVSVASIQPNERSNMDQERSKIESEFNKTITHLNNQITQRDICIGNIVEEKNDIVEKYEAEVKFLKGKLKESITQNFENKLLAQKFEV